MEKVEFFPNPIPMYLYQQFNKDRLLNKFFYSSRVGKCVQMFDEYYHSVQGKISKEDWTEYYLSRVERQNLIAPAHFMAEKYRIEMHEAAEYVLFRVVGQTWNGMMNEVNCINHLQEWFPNIDFRKTSYEIDEEYCTDWEAFSNGKLLFGLQIKPESYHFMRTPYQMKAKENHQKQVDAYKEKFGVAHFFVFYSNNKFIHSQPLFNQINTYLALNINVQL